MKLAPLIVHFLTLQQTRRAWKPQTLLREALNLHGALAHLPVYSTWPFPAELTEDPTWTSAVRAMQHNASEAQPVGQPAAALDDVLLALDREADPLARAALMITWATGARAGCCALLTAHNVQVAPTVSPQTHCHRLKVRFTRGKGAKARGPYTVHSAVSPLWATELRRLLASRPTGPLFPARVPSAVNPRAEVSLQERLLQTIRLASDDLSTRALRRGSLQALAHTLAAQGVPQSQALEQLMSFSGHTNETTLKRYLDWGSAFPTAADQGELVAAGALAARC
jgi:hypothetical protein